MDKSVYMPKIQLKQTYLQRLPCKDERVQINLERIEQSRLDQAEKLMWNKETSKNKHNKTNEVYLAIR